MLPILRFGQTYASDLKYKNDEMEIYRFISTNLWLFLR